MKIRLNISPSRGAHWIREGVKTFQYVLALPALIITASLLPGDNQHIGTFAWVIGMVMLLMIDAIVSLPALAFAKRLDRPVVAPVAPRDSW
jgi:hypothetical protein